MNRRASLVLLLAVGLASMPVRGDNPRKPCRVGGLSLTAPHERYRTMDAALLDMGYEPGRNIEFDYRFAQGNADRLAAMASDLVTKKVDVIIARTNQDVAAAMRATSTIPIVMTFGGTPVELGLVASLSRPGGNVTGTIVQGPETGGKMLSLLRDVVPHARKVAYIWDPGFPGMEVYRRAVERAAGAVGLQLTGLPGRNAAEIDAALARLAKDRHDGLYVVITGPIFEQRARIIEFAARQRLPTIYTAKVSVLEGGLMSYTADFVQIMRRSAAIVDRICQGATPSEIPVEQPTRFELVINLKTARALGVTVPQSLLLRADEVIE